MVVVCVDFTTNGALNVKVLRDCISYKGANICINAINGQLCENASKKCQLLARKKSVIFVILPYPCQLFSKNFQQFTTQVFIPKN